MPREVLEVIALLFDLGSRWMWVLQHHSPAGLPPGNSRYPLYMRLDGPVWTGVENLAPTGIRSPDRPTRSGSLYRVIWGFPVRNTALRVAALSGSSAIPGAVSFGRTNLH
jgi:hypothetical protein